MKENRQLEYIVSVGGLPNSVTTESYLSGDLSVLRNPILANIFHRLNLIEKFGNGGEEYGKERTTEGFWI